jgi:2-oxoglutarate ferredoxin oxidoreductase subunit alpha
MRLRAYPFTEELEAFIDHHQRIYVVEQNRDAQMLSLMRLALSAERGAKLRKVLHYNGLPIDARSITDEILAQEAPAAGASREVAERERVGVGPHEQ